jgi:AAA domain-containing protein
VSPFLWKADDLYAADLPPTRFIVEGILPPGETILGGRPKIGKSLLLLNLALAVAGSTRALGRLEVDAGAVLLLALEDTERRLQDRLRKMSDTTVPPSRLSIATRWSRGQPGVDLLKQWVETVRDPRLVLVDTVAKFRARRTKDGNPYGDDYDDYSAIKEIADEAGIGIVLNTHERKGGAEDMVEAITGTTGQTGAADTTMILRRKRGESDGKLFIVGRDIEDCTMSLTLDRETLRWSMQDDIQVGHPEWETSMKPASVNLRLDRTDDFLVWAKAQMNGQGEYRLPTQECLLDQDGPGLSRRELQEVVRSLRAEGRIVHRSGKKSRGESNDYFLRNGEWSDDHH